MIDVDELRMKHGMTDEELASLESDAKRYENGNWPEGKTTIMGRPPLYDDDELTNVTFRIRKSRLLAIDRMASRTGESRSEFFREAIDRALSESA